jgi:HAE1 family hydrophobic/amphiphilic exporter-1
LASGLLRVIIIGTLLAIFAVSTFIIPSPDYLPQGNQNLFLTIMIMPPGQTLEETTRLMEQVEQRFYNHPARARMFAVSRLGDPIMGIIIKDEFSDRANMQRIHGELWGMAEGLPGVVCIVTQASLFQRGFTGSKVVTLDITGPDLEEIVRISQEIQRAAQQIEGVQSVQSSFKAGNPELQVEIDTARATELGLTVADVADVVETAVGGVDISLYRERGNEYDIVLKSDESLLVNPDSLRGIEITTASGRTLPLSSVAGIVETSGPTAINHIERERSVTLSMTISEDVALQTVIDAIEEQIATPLRERLPPSYRIEFSGSADDLWRTLVALSGTLILALIITYLLLTALFESFVYPIVIMITLPVAATGSLLGLAIFRNLAEFNVITMFGFVILIGIVVNNAILIVAQTLNHMRNDHQPSRQALEHACMDRLRPIFMSTLSSILGMLPLAIGTGNGSELYRGLGIVVVGGLTLSTLFTLVLVPSVFMFFLRLGERFGLAGLSKEVDAPHSIEDD